MINEIRYYAPDKDTEGSGTERQPTFGENVGGPFHRVADKFRALGMDREAALFDEGADKIRQNLDGLDQPTEEESKA